MEKTVTRKDIEKKLRERLLYLREEKSKQLKKTVTQEDVAKQTGVARTSILAYERGAAIPDSEKLYKLADYYGVSCDYLLGREEGKNRDINYIMEETGLSEKAINQLEYYTYDDDFHLELFAINQIIEASDCTNFLKAFAKYISTPKIDDDDLDDIYSMILPFFEGVMVPLIGVKNNEDVVEYEHISSDDLLYLLLIKEYNKLLDHIKNDKKTKSKLMKHLIDLLKPYYEDELYNVYVYSKEYDDYNIEDLKVDKSVLKKVMQKYLHEKELESKRIQEEIISNLSSTD